MCKCASNEANKLVVLAKVWNVLISFLSIRIYSFFFVCQIFLEGFSNTFFVLRFVSCGNVFGVSDICGFLLFFGVTSICSVVNEYTLVSSQRAFLGKNSKNLFYVGLFPFQLDVTSVGFAILS